MRSGDELKTHSDYVSVLRPLLPPEAFAPQPRHLGRIAVHLIIVGAGYAAMRFTPSPWLWPLLGIVIGHSVACLALLAHDVSHSGVVRSGPLKTGIEIVLWGLNVIPPTMWRRLHNQTHHVETNTVHDTDRLYRRSEETRWTRLYTRLFFPTAHTLAGAPVVLVHFVTYIVRHLVTVFLPGRHKPSIVTHKPDYSARDKARIAAELFAIGLMQWGIFAAVDGGWRFFWASPFAVCVASSVVMAYVWTNHLLNPLCEHTDPLAGSTSVIVPKWADWLHDNFSYHTEHHVFPTMNPRFYPEVSRLLQEHFPDRYQRLPFAEAWRRIWQGGEFIVERDGRK